MNYYRAFSFLVLLTLFVVLALTSQFHEDRVRVIWSYEQSSTLSVANFRILVLLYLLSLSGSFFWMSKRSSIGFGFFVAFILLIAASVLLFSMLLLLPEFTIKLFDTYYGSYPGSYYACINDYGLLNVCLVIVHSLGLGIFVLKGRKALKWRE